MSRLQVSFKTPIKQVSPTTIEIELPELNHPLLSPEANKVLDTLDPMQGEQLLDRLYQEWQRTMIMSQVLVVPTRFNLNVKD